MNLQSSNDRDITYKNINIRYLEKEVNFKKRPLNIKITSFLNTVLYIIYLSFLLDYNNKNIDAEVLKSFFQLGSLIIIFILSVVISSSIYIFSSLLSIQFIARYTSHKFMSLGHNNLTKSVFFDFFRSEESVIPIDKLQSLFKGFIMYIILYFLILIVYAIINILILYIVKRYVLTGIISNIFFISVHIYFTNVLEIISNEPHLTQGNNKLINGYHENQIVFNRNKKHTYAFFDNLIDIFLYIISYAFFGSFTISLYILFIRELSTIFFFTLSCIMHFLSICILSVLKFFILFIFLYNFLVAGKEVVKGLEEASKITDSTLHNAPHIKAFNNQQAELVYHFKYNRTPYMYDYDHFFTSIFGFQGYDDINVLTGNYSFYVYVTLKTIDVLLYAFLIIGFFVLLAIMISNASFNINKILIIVKKNKTLIKNFSNVPTNDHELYNLMKIFLTSSKSNYDNVITYRFSRNNNIPITLLDKQKLQRIIKTIGDLVVHMWSNVSFFIFTTLFTFIFTSYSVVRSSDKMTSLFIKLYSVIQVVYSLSVYFAQISNSYKKQGLKKGYFDYYKIKNKVYKLYDKTPIIKIKNFNVSINSKIFKSNDLAFKIQTKSYNRVDNNILIKDINLNIYCGDSIAIIGKSGSGKTTFLRQLISNFPIDKSVNKNSIVSIYDEQIILGAMNPNFSIYNHHTIDVFLHRSILANLLYCYDSKDTITFLSACYKLKSKQLTGYYFINHYRDIISYINNVLTVACIDFLPKISIDSMDIFLNGNVESFSSGQKQRLLIAMCLLKKNSSIFIFDEFAMHVDIYNQFALDKNILNFLKKTGSIGIFVTHRLNFLSKVNYCLMIKNNRFHKIIKPKVEDFVNNTFSFN